MPFTQDGELELLFDPKLVPDSSKKALPSDLHIRPLAASDYGRGHLRVLQALTKTPDPGQEAYRQAFERMKSSSPQSYYILAIVDTNTDALLAAGSVFLEHKFIRNLGICGHIEDIAVDPSTQGKGLGKIIINALTELSESLGSYKVILDCSEDVRKFYEKCGYVCGRRYTYNAPLLTSFPTRYEYKGVQMAKYK